MTAMARGKILEVRRESAPDGAQGALTRRLLAHEGDAAAQYGLRGGASVRPAADGDPVVGEGSSQRVGRHGEQQVRTVGGAQWPGPGLGVTSAVARFGDQRRYEVGAGGFLQDREGLL